jgi:hypothetical protein
MSIYEELALDDKYVKCLVKEIPNSSDAYDEEAFLVRFEQNLAKGQEIEHCSSFSIA